jgi:hypothetical protein
MRGADLFHADRPVIRSGSPAFLVPHTMVRPSPPTAPVSRANPRTPHPAQSSPWQVRWSNSKSLPYFYNPSTDESRWEPPTGMSAEQVYALSGARETYERQQQQPGAAAGQDGQQGEEEKVRASHLLIKHSGSRRPASWKNVRPSPSSRVTPSTSADPTSPSRRSQTSPPQNPPPSPTSAPSNPTSSPCRHKTCPARSPRPRRGRAIARVTQRVGIWVGLHASRCRSRSR